MEKKDTIERFMESASGEVIERASFLKKYPSELAIRENDLSRSKISVFSFLAHAHEALK